MNANAATFTSAPSATVARRYAACVNLFEGATTAGEATAAAGRIEALESKGARFDGELYFQSLLDDTDNAGTLFSVLSGCLSDGWSWSALCYLIGRFDLSLRNAVVDWMMAHITEWNDLNTTVWNALEATR